MFTSLFGPVPSRRLGMSLGIDLVPKKVCSLDCVYCEVGATTKLTLERREYVPCDRIVAELDAWLDANPDPDYLTFSGSGEPTLNTRIGDVLAYAKRKRPALPVALLTNGTLLGLPEVRDAVLGADLVLPSLDAATEGVFRRLNRPAPGLEAGRCVEDLAAFRAAYRGRIWLEVFILPGYNDSDAELDALKAAMERIGPDRIQLNTLDRPGTVPDLRSATQAELRAVLERWKLPNAEIIAPAPERKRIASYRPDAESAILETVRRRPCTLDDLSRVLGMHINEVNKYLDVLEAEDLIEATRQDRGVFYRTR
ncbi:MAG: radical SAM protein [Spirochaetales bacterium]|nr:radical SAM protein [Spirochaetales bacterium]